MDDSEYYRKMREQYSHNPFSKKKSIFSGNKTALNTTHSKWENFQGREDAEMLQEKTENPSLQNSESITEEN